MSKFSKLVSGLMVVVLGFIVNAYSHAKSNTPRTVKLPKVYSELNKFKHDNPKAYLFTLNSRVYDFSKAPAFFKNLKQYKKVNPEKYVVTYVQSGRVKSNYDFKLNQNDIKCILAEHGISEKATACEGLLPGSSNSSLDSKIKMKRSVGMGIYPMPAKMTLMTHGEDGFNLYKDSEMQEKIQLKLLPVGYMIYLPKQKNWDPNAVTTTEQYNTGVLCIVPSNNTFGCVNTFNNGFYIDNEGTHTF